MLLYNEIIIAEHAVKVSIFHAKTEVKKEVKLRKYVDVYLESMNMYRWWGFQGGELWKKGRWTVL